MYYWRIDNLKKDLAKGPLPESESFMYLVVFLILLGIGAMTPVEDTPWDVIAAYVVFVIQIIGTFYVYKCNNGSSGSNFLQKYLSINWVLGIRWLVMVLLPIMFAYFVFAWVIGVMYDIDIFQYDFPSLVISSFIYIYFYWLFGKHMKDILKQE